jgi:hypothetical protein
VALGGARRAQRAAELIAALHIVPAAAARGPTCGRPAAGRARGGCAFQCVPLRLALLLGLLPGRRSLWNKVADSAGTKNVALHSSVLLGAYGLT